MITLDGIYENIISEAIIFFISILISWIAPNLMKKSGEVKEKSKFDILKLTIFLTCISILNFILNLSFWNKQNLTILFTLLSLVFGYSSYHIYNNQCPSCKKFIGVKKKVGEDIIREFKKEIPYQPMKIWKYSNGSIKKKEPFGERTVRTEVWQTKRKFYECDDCNHKWDSGHIDEPLSIEKESHTIINTQERDPNEANIY